MSNAVFDIVAFARFRNLGQLGNMPNGVSPLYKELVAANPAKRPNPKEKLDAMRRSGGYFKNELIDAIVFLEELQIKEESEKGSSTTYPYKL